MDYIKGSVFTKDETKSTWHREDNIELLRVFCPEGYGMAQRYSHFIIGNGTENDYIGIPGRFMLSEQPAGGKTGFTLWQPIRGGEEWYDELQHLDEEKAGFIYGYWIARIDGETLEICEV